MCGEVTLAGEREHRTQHDEDAPNARLRKPFSRSLQAVFAAIYANEIAAVLRDGGVALVREKLADLSDGERRALRIALDAA